jgi:hypothetical protein
MTALQSVDKPTMPVLNVDRQKLIDLMEPCFTGHRYAMGAKPELGSASNYWSWADCSGFVRWLLYGAAGVTLPEGSVEIHDWCRANKFQVVDYRLSGSLMDDRLRIAFINPTQAEPGHVWLVINGQTIESYGGHGPGRRPWNAPIDGGSSSLARAASACYVLSNR